MKSSHASIPVFVPHVGCPQRCSFCDQNTISGAYGMPSPQEAAEICRRGLDELPDKFPKAEIAFFGGSFTAIPRREMEGLLEAVQPLRNHPRFGGIRISTRPDALSVEIIGILKKAGVQAIELGAQSLYNEVLEANGRGHTAQDVAAAAALVRQEGLELGLQMMTGLYRSTLERDWNTGLKIAQIHPDTVRIYPTAVLRGTRLAALLAEGVYTPPSLEETVELCARLLELFQQQDIRVIRLGLPASPSLERDAVGGCVHPALGELCRSRVFRHRICQEAERHPGAVPACILVPSRELSQAVGQKQCNLSWFRQRWPGVVIRPEQGLERGFRMIFQDTEEVSYAASGY